MGRSDKEVFYGLEQPGDGDLLKDVHGKSQDKFLKRA
jgi:hypothetical protein